MKKGILLLIIISFLLLGCNNIQKKVAKEDNLNQLRTYENNEKIGPKKKVAITIFKNETVFGKRRFGENISSIISTEMQKTGRFILIDSKKINEILKAGEYKVEGKQEFVNELDADYIITGAITKYAVNTVGNNTILKQEKIQRAETSIDIQIYNVKTNELIYSEAGEGSAEKVLSKVLGLGASGGYDESLEQDALRAAIISSMDNILKTFDSKSWFCNVVKINGEKLYLNAGKLSNVKIGEQLYLYRIGEKITDLNGDLLGFEEEKIATVNIIDYFGENGSVAETDVKLNLDKPLICKIK